MGLHGCCRQNMNNFFKSKFLWITWLLSQNYPHLCSLTNEQNRTSKVEAKLRIKKTSPKVIDRLHQFFSGVHDKGSVLSDGLVQSLS